jgi:hypothetical protein
MTPLDKETIILLQQVIAEGGCDRVSLSCMHLCPIKRSFHYGVNACQRESVENAKKYLNRFPLEYIFEALL